MGIAPDKTLKPSLKSKPLVPKKYIPACLPGDDNDGIRQKIKLEYRLPSGPETVIQKIKTSKKEMKDIQQ